MWKGLSARVQLIFAVICKFRSAAKAWVDLTEKENSSNIQIPLQYDFNKFHFLQLKLLAPVLHS